MLPIYFHQGSAAQWRWPKWEDCLVLPRRKCWRGKRNDSLARGPCGVSRMSSSRCCFPVCFPHLGGVILQDLLPVVLCFGILGILSCFFLEAGKMLLSLFSTAWSLSLKHSLDWCFPKEPEKLSSNTLCAIQKVWSILTFNILRFLDVEKHCWPHYKPLLLFIIGKNSLVDLDICQRGVLPMNFTFRPAKA